MTKAIIQSTIMKPILLGTAILLLACGTSRRKPQLEICNKTGFSRLVETVSFSDIDRIKSLNGQFIEIDGYFYDEFEDVALFPSRHVRNSDHALWINCAINDSLLQRFEQRQIRIIGRVDTSDKGHLGSYLGSLDSVFCVKTLD